MPRETAGRDAIAPRWHRTTPRACGSTILLVGRLRRGPARSPRSHAL